MEGRREGGKEKGEREGRERERHSTSVPVDGPTHTQIYREHLVDSVCYK